MLDRVKKALSGGGLAIGTHCATQDATFYELCGFLGYDFVWIEGEHTDMTGPMVVNAIIAAQAGGCAAFVRVPWNNPVLAKPVLEAGPDGIIFPMINSAEECELAISSCRYPPNGKRGFGPNRAMKFGEMPLDEYLEHVEKNVWRIIQIEHLDAINDLDRILQVEGLSAVFCGAMDLSGSIGKIGQLNDPQMIDMMGTMAEKCKKSGIPFGVSSAGDSRLLDFWVERGANLIGAGDPYGYFARISRQVLQEYRKVKVKS